MKKTYQSKAMIMSILLGLAVFISACSTSTGTTNAGTNTGLPAVKVTTPSANVSPAVTPAASSSPAVTTPGQGSETVTYASVVLTVVSVVQQSSFVDDTSASGPFVVRVNLKEQNPTDQDIFLFYNDNMRLLTPDGKSNVPTSVEFSGGVAQSVVRTNWLDFSFAAKQSLDTLILHIGAPTERQIDVPLSKDPDLSKYQATSTAPGTKLNYDGLNWTIVKVTAGLSAVGKQATSGNRYITVDLQADNSTDGSIYPFPDDNFRLKGDGATQAPTHSTLPGGIAAHSTNTTGSVVFLMPQAASQFTLDFLAQSSAKIAESTTTFTIK